MNNIPFISVITINLNNYWGLEKTINSVISQSCKDFEYIVIDGCSTDGSGDLLRRYKKDITIGIIEPDTGIYNAMNKGVLHARGEYCLFLNSGDTLADSKVMENLLKLDLKADVITGDTILIPGSKTWKAPHEVSLLTFMKGSLSHQSSLIRRSLLMRYPYDETNKIVSDWKFCIETLIMHGYSYAAVDMTISLYDKQGISSNPSFFAQADAEKRKSLSELIPERILCDYRSLIEGDTPYMKFMIRISRNKRYAQLVYSVLYFITKMYCSVFHKQLLKDL